MPSASSLPETLAQRVRHLREQQDMPPEVLAWKARVPLSMVEDIEAGIETFLSPAIRSRLARVLHVRPAQLREVETPPEEAISLEVPVLQRKSLDLLEAIRQDPQGAFHCPRCQAPLVARLFERRDLQDQTFTVVKAHCTQCMFRLTDD